MKLIENQNRCRDAEWISADLICLLVDTNMSRTVAWIITLSVPALTLAVQWTLWPLIEPYAWFLFYPTVFSVALLTGLTGGMIATVESALFVWFFFIPPQLSLTLQRSADLFSIAIFALTGIAFSLFSSELVPFVWTGFYCR